MAPRNTDWPQTANLSSRCTDQFAVAITLGILVYLNFLNSTAKTKVLLQDFKNLEYKIYKNSKFSTTKLPKKEKTTCSRYSPRPKEHTGPQHFSPRPTNSWSQKNTQADITLPTQVPHGLRVPLVVGGSQQKKPRQITFFRGRDSPESIPDGDTVQDLQHFKTKSFLPKP